jgi:hypothetical protein
VVIRFGLATALFAGARRSFNIPAAFAIALVVAIAQVQLAEMVIGLIVAVSVAVTVTEHRRILLSVAALSAFAGLELSNKVSYGLALAVMTAVLAPSLPGRRRDFVVAAAAGLLCSLLVLWMALGQSLTA